MNDINIFYKEFLDYKIRSPKTYSNLIKKIRSFEDFKYLMGLSWFLITKILVKHYINNETVRGR